MKIENRVCFGTMQASKFRPAIAGALVFLMAFAFAVEDAFKLAKGGKEGDSRKYEINASIDIMGDKLKVYQKYKVTLKKLGSDGTYVEESQALEGKIEFQGNESPMPAGGKDTVTYDKRGRVTKEEKAASSEEGDDEGTRLSQLGMFYYPEEDVKVGSKWEIKVDGKESRKTVDTKHSFEVLGKATVGGIETAKIKFYATEAKGSAPAEMSGTIWVDLKTGDLVKQEATFKGVPLSGMAVDGSFSMNVEGL